MARSRLDYILQQKQVNLNGQGTQPSDRPSQSSQSTLSRKFRHDLWASRDCVSDDTSF